MTAELERVGANLLASLEDSGWISKTALVIDRPGLPFEKFEALGSLIGGVGSASRFWAGDYLVIAEHLYGELAPQAAESLNMSPDGMQECIRVALAFPRSQRRASVSWWHHRLLAAKWVTPALRTELLDRVENERLTTRDLGAILRGLRALGSGSRGATAECDQILEEAVAALIGCGYPDDLVLTLSAPGVEVSVRAAVAA